MNQNLALQSLKSDFLFLNEMTRPSQISHIQVPTNLTQLHNVLRKKNSKLPLTDFQRQAAMEKMIKFDGADLSKIKDQLRKAKQVVLKKQQLKKFQQDCHFYIPDMSYKNIDNYLQKATEYSILSTISKTMKKTNLVSKIMKRNQQKFSGIGPIKRKAPQKQIGIVTQINTQIRDNEKRQKYIKSIMLLATGQIDRNEYVHYLNNVINKKFWKIFSRHIKCLQQQRPDETEKNTYLYLESLKLVQEEYQQTITKGSNSLNQQLQFYLKNADLAGDLYIRDGQYKSFWGKIFLLYRAGRIRQVYNLLSTRNQNQMMTYIQRAEQSIAKKNPISLQNYISNEKLLADMFRDELIYILKGEMKYSSKTLLQADTLDLVYVYLRSQAIFPQKSQRFERTKQQLLERYSKQFFQTKTILLNYLFLLNYDRIAEIGLSEIMDQDDYLHFLICIYQNSDLIDRDTYQKIQKMLTKELIFTIKQLINLGRKEYVYYMSLIPAKDRITEISVILANSNLISTVDWPFFMQTFSRQQYNKLVKSTLDKYLLATGDYMGVASNYVQLLNQYEQAIRCLLKLLIKNVMNNHLNLSQVKETEKLCTYYMGQQRNLQQKYQFTLFFIQNCRKLSQTLLERNYQSILSLVHQNKFIIWTQNYDMKHLQVLQNLIQISGLGLDAYCRFIKNVIKGLELYYARQRQDQIYRGYIQRIREGMEILFNQNKFASFINRQQSRSAMEMVNNMYIKVVPR